MPPRDAAVAAPVEPGATPPSGPRWIPGDLHMHVVPVDDDAMLDVAGVAAGARAETLEFVILTPHLHPRTWRDRERRARWLRAWTAMAKDARAEPGVTLIPGVEWTVGGYGHFGLSGVDLATIPAAADPAEAVHDRGGLVVVNHPFATPTKIPGVRASHHDLSFRPWTHGKGEVPSIDAVEVWNVPQGIADLLKGKEVRAEDRAFTAADQLARRERRPVAVVGGTDNHLNFVAPTTWVRADDAGEASILAAIRAGRVCVGGPEAGGLEARGDGDDAWVGIGDSVRASSRVELRWPGRARLFVDGADRGEHDGGFVHEDARGVHTYRIVVGESRCGFVYANLTS